MVLPWRIILLSILRIIRTYATIPYHITIYFVDWTKPQDKTDWDITRHAWRAVSRRRIIIAYTDACMIRVGDTYFMIELGKRYNYHGLNFIWRNHYGLINITFMSGAHKTKLVSEVTRGHLGMDLFGGTQIRLALGLNIRCSIWIICL